MSDILIRIPATQATRDAYLARLNAAWERRTGRAEVIHPAPWATAYERVADGVRYWLVRAPEIDAAFAADVDTSGTQMVVEYRDAVDPAEFAPVAEEPSP